MRVLGLNSLELGRDFLVQADEVVVVRIHQQVLEGGLLVRGEVGWVEREDVVAGEMVHDDLEELGIAVRFHRRRAVHMPVIEEEI